MSAGESAREEPIDHIRHRHPGEWLLIEITEPPETSKVRRGRLIAHDLSSGEVERISSSLPRRVRAFVTFADGVPKDRIYCLRYRSIPTHL